jgi:ABC-type polar amino acid transport system ATPase subunit
MNPQLKIANLEFSYGSRKILNSISLEVNKGEILAIIGKSGSGKSTLLKCLSVMIEAEKGDVFLNDQQIIQNGIFLYEAWEIRQRMMIVFQEYNLFPNMTVLSNIKIALEKVKNIDKTISMQIALSICDKLNLTGIKDKYPNEISGGEAQRTALARAIVLKPQVLLLDEITSAIDPSTILNVIKVINELKISEETKDTSIILVTHNIRFAVDYADSIAFLYDGKIHEQLDANKFITEAKSVITQEYINDSKYFI